VRGGIRDLVASHLDWHQFRATAGRRWLSLLVNTQRDRPQLPNAEDLASLRAIPASRNSSTEVGARFGKFRMKINGRDYRSIWLDADGRAFTSSTRRSSLRLRNAALSSLDDAVVAIRDMIVRGRR